MRSQGKSRATIVVVPRERWSFARRSLADLHAKTEPPYELVYVDGGSPEPVRSAIAADVARMGHRLVRTDELLSPNQARNLGARGCDTEYTVFIDNDELVERGWLERLVACADETGAWIVGPMYCVGLPAGRRVHMAGGRAYFEEGPRGRLLHDQHVHANEPRDEVARVMRRAECEQVEFHCMLVRTDALARLGPLDEELLSVAEHTDLCLLAREAGGSVWVEPEAVTTYVYARWLSRIDIPYYKLRWSEPWNGKSVARFGEKWNLAPDDPWRAQVFNWAEMHRVEGSRRSKLLRVLFGSERGYALARRFEGGLLDGVLAR